MENLCFKITEARDVTKVIGDLEKSVFSEDDRKLYDNFLLNYDKFKSEWRNWTDIKTWGQQMEFQEVGGERFSLLPGKVDLNSEMLTDRAMLRAPGQVLSNWQNRCFAGIDVIYQLRQETSYLKPSEEFRNNFIKNMMLTPDINETIDRPNFDRRPGVRGNLKSKIEGVYFEVEDKKGGKITAFFDIPTLMKIVELPFY